MLTYYFDTLAADYSFFNVFRYLTFRAVCAVLTALALSLLMGPIMIRRLTSMRIGATIRNDGPTSHFREEWYSDYGWRVDCVCSCCDDIGVG